MTRKWLFVIFIGLCIFVSGCKTKQNCDLQEDVCGVASNRDEEKENFNHDISLFQEIYTGVYDNSEKNRDTVKNVIEKFGQAGYVAVDCENHVNMTCADELLDFIRKHEACEREKIQVIQVSYDGGFSLFDICTSEGEVCVYQTYYKYIDGQITESQTIELKVTFFSFTDEGYLMIEGQWHLPEQYILTLSEEEEHIALRVSPLEDMCRELCDKYIVPVSYRRNNMFITEWNQEDYSNLDFYDLFEKFYYETNKTNFPYVMNDNLSIGNEYYISSEKFENVIMQHIQVTENELQDLLRYDSETGSYIFRPRGFCEFDYAHVPYPEVVSYRENSDGTLTLLVYAVFPTDNTSKLFAHEVTVKDKNGEIYYLSNHILEDRELNLWWHADRYTDEEWEEYYGGNVEEQETEENIDEEGDISWMFPNVESELFSEEEKAQLESEIMSIVKNVWNLYDNVTISEGTSYNSGIIGFTKEQRMAVVTALGKNNVVATSENINMVNGKKLEAFYQNYKNNKEDCVTIYDVYNDGLIAAVTFLYRNGEIQEYYVAIKPDKNGEPYLTEKIVQEIDFINLTKKGYFIYANKYQLSHASRCQYWRVSPLSEQCRELTEKYLKYLDLKKYDMLAVDWDAENVSEVLQAGLFEDFYYIKYGECFTGNHAQISGELFEQIMMAYLPVSVEQLRNAFQYNDSDNTYYQDIVYGSPNSPFLEVTDYKNNADGTITLYADGVWPDYNSDYAFTNVIVVRPASDDTFRILSNDVEEQELQLP